MQGTMKKIFSFFSIFCFLKLVQAEEGDDRLTTKGKADKPYVWRYSVILIVRQSWNQNTVMFAGHGQHV